MNTLRRIAVTMFAAALPWAGPNLFAQAPGNQNAGNHNPGQLPTNRVGEFVTAIGHAQIRDALLVALNSPGDSIRLHCSTGFSVGLGANVGAEAGIEAEVERLATGGFLVSVAESVAATGGVEAYEGLELNASIGCAPRVQFLWPTLQDTSDGLMMLAGGVELMGTELANTATNAFDTVRYAADALREAIANTAAAQAVYDGLAHANVDAARAVAGLRADAARARRNLDHLRRQVRSAERRLDALPWWLRAPVRLLLHELERSLRSDGALHRAIEGSLRAAELTADAALASLRAARHALDAAYRDEDAARRLYASAQATVDSARAFAQAMVGIGDELAAHCYGVAFTVVGAGSIEAAIGPAGVSLENVGAGVSLTSSIGATIDWHALGGGASALNVALFQQLELAAFAGMGVGVRSEINGGLSIAAEWHKQRGEAFRFADLTTSIEADFAVMAVVGAGVAVRHGVGEHIQIAMDQAQWQRAAASLRSLGGGLDSATLSQALAGIECDATTTLRWIAQVVASAGGSWAGTGAHFDAGFGWDDLGEPLHCTWNAGMLFDQLRAAAWQEAELAVLTARM